MTGQMSWKGRWGVGGGRPQPKEFGYYSSGSWSGHGCAWEHSPATLGKISGGVLGWPIRWKAGRPFQWAGPQGTEIEGEIQAPPQSFADSHSVGMVGWGAQEGVGLVSPLDIPNTSSAQTGCWVGIGIHGPQHTRNNSFPPHHPEGPTIPFPRTCHLNFLPFLSRG